MERPLSALITAGGTREPIDDVRVITNLSTGRFGTSIARALQQRGVRTTLLGSREAVARLGVDSGVACVPFGSYDDLARELERLIAAGPPDLLLMAAAVSDYRPRPQAGKLRSDAESLTLELERTPKLLTTLRERCGDATFLVGFKLLSGVSADELVGVARRQLDAARLDLTVANDLSELGGQDHPVTLVSANDTQRLAGPRDVVAAALADALLERCQGAAPPAEHDEQRALQVLCSEAGLELERVSWRARQVACPAHALLFEQLPRLECLVELGGARALPDACSISDADPASEVWAAAACQALAEAALAGRWAGGAFAVRRGGSLLLGLEAGGAARLQREWHAAAGACREQAPGVRALGEAVCLQPLLASARIAGCVVAARDGTWQAPFLLAPLRGRGLGDRLAQDLDSAGVTVGVPPGGDHQAYFVARGFRVAGEHDGVSLLEPPSLRDDLGAAASVCLVDPVRRRVLLGRRANDPGRGAWAFPGGRLQAGEAPLAGALRELEEETGIRLAAPRPLASMQVAVAADPDGRLGYRISCFCLLSLGAAAPQPSEELVAEWVPLASVASRRPLVAGARRVLRELPGWLAR